jgi:phosphoglycerol transferase MdoB-like AlkP superfamily enzyme
MYRSINKWDIFLKEISNLIFFWFFSIVFFFLYRFGFVVAFHKEIAINSGFGEYFKVFLRGFAFDCTAVSYFLILPLLATIILSPFGKGLIIKNIRISVQYLFVILSTFVCLIMINYYREYHEQFNNFLFLGLEDDKKAILNTIIEYYNPVLNSLLLIVIIVAGIFIFRFFENENAIYNQLAKLKSKYTKAGLVIAVLACFVMSIRGSMGRVPATRKWAYVSVDPFLNKTIINPYRSLKYAYADFKEFNEISGANPFGNESLRDFYGKNEVAEVIEKTAQGDSLIAKPKQVFLIIMESYDAWPLMDKYLPFGFSKNLHRIAQNGIHFTNFLPAYQATFYAYATITSGIPYCGVNISRLATMKDRYITSIFEQFKALGYKTNMFYGGFLSWENMGEYTAHLGCENIYSGANMGGKSDSGEWGVEDEKLFDMILQNVNPDEYTFNLVLTSSYHPPYAIDTEKKGFMYKTEADFPEEVKQYYTGGMNMLEMGHLWYGDLALGQFMDRAESKYETALFGFTGDHYGRRFINHSPNLAERSEVPFILYGKGIPRMKSTTPGGHADIAPTLIELIAPAGFKYYSFGSSMLDSTKTCGIGFEKVIDRDFLYHQPKDAKVDEISLVDFKEKKEEHFKFEKEYKELMRLSWHYTVKGNKLE